MASYSITEEIESGLATYFVSGRFESTSAWDLAARLRSEPRAELVLDFSRVDAFVDYSIAVLASALLSLGDKRIHLRGIRTHQLRMLRYFGVEPKDLLRPLPSAEAAPEHREAPARELV